MSKHENTNRADEVGCAALVADLHCYSDDKQLSDAERQDVIEWVSRFEECFYSTEELLAMTDERLIEASYSVMADYASGQL